MDVLKSLINERKNLTQELKSTAMSLSSKEKKYIRRGELENALDEKLRREQEIELERKRKMREVSATMNDDTTNDSLGSSSKKSRMQDKQTREGHADGEVASYTQNEIELLPVEEVKKKLRSLGKPITLFGETAKERQLRLVEAQHESVAGNHDLSIAADYAVSTSFRDKDGLLSPGGQNDKALKDEEEKEEAFDEEDAGERPADDNKYVYRFFKRMLKLWERDLSARPETVKRTAQGKIATKTMKQCKDYIRPLFKQCKSRDVPDDILKKLTDIVKFCEEKDFVRANDAYISVAIGNAAWPIGVTMVGIHERTGREKINSSKVAHVMNNEAQRKYLTSVKRLISYCQSISDAPPSKRVT